METERCTLCGGRHERGTECPELLERPITVELTETQAVAVLTRLQGDQTIKRIPDYKKHLTNAAYQLACAISNRGLGGHDAR